MRYPTHGLVFVSLVITALAFATAAHADLVARWSFDTDYSDSSGNGYDFTLTSGSVPIVAGKVGGAASLDGFSSQLNNSSTGLVDTAYTAFTLGAFVFVESTPPGIGGGGGDAAILAGAGYSLGLTFHTDNYVYAYAGAGAQNTSSPMTIGAWHHVAQTYDGGLQVSRLYIDGAFVSQKSGVPTSITPGDIRIGLLGSATSYLDGLVDEAFFYNEVLSDSQIASIAAVPEPGAFLLVGVVGIGCFAYRKWLQAV